MQRFRHRPPRVLCLARHRWLRPWLQSAALPRRGSDPEACRNQCCGTTARVCSAISSVCKSSARRLCNIMIPRDPARIPEVLRLLGTGVAATAGPPVGPVVAQPPACCFALSRALQYRRRHLASSSRHPESAACPIHHPTCVRPRSLTRAPTNRHRRRQTAARISVSRHQRDACGEAPFCIVIHLGSGTDCPQ